MHYLQAVERWLSLILNRFSELPSNGALIHSAGNSSGLAMNEAYPISQFPVAETNAEVTNLQSLTAKFVDARTSTLWINDGSGWVSSGYNGSDSMLQPGTLCYSPPTGKMYYCDHYLRMIRANMTTGSTPR
jgi:hypothetical protein